MRKCHSWAPTIPKPKNITQYCPNTIEIYKRCKDYFATQKAENPEKPPSPPEDIIDDVNAVIEEFKENYQKKKTGPLVPLDVVDLLESIGLVFQAPSVIKWEDECCSTAKFSSRSRKSPDSPDWALWYHFIKGNSKHDAVVYISDLPLCNEYILWL